MAYIRGSNGLEQKVLEISTTTAGMLRYIGEWHSHPKGSGTTPSGADRQLLGWVGDLMDREGLPGVMGILGDDEQLSFYLDGQTVSK